jgi:hypothetical protein
VTIIVPAEGRPERETVHLLRALLLDGGAGVYVELVDPDGDIAFGCVVNRRAEAIVDAAAVDVPSLSVREAHLIAYALLGVTADSDSSVPGDDADADVVVPRALRTA